MLHHHHHFQLLSRYMLCRFTIFSRRVCIINQCWLLVYYYLRNQITWILFYDSLHRGRTTCARNLWRVFYFLIWIKIYLPLTTLPGNKSYLLLTNNYSFNIYFFYDSFIVPTTLLTDTIWAFLGLGIGEVDYLF